MIERERSPGASPEKIEKMTREAERYKEMCQNPLINVALTFAEVFPMGLGVTLPSSAILRKNRRSGRPEQQSPPPTAPSAPGSIAR